MLLRTLPPLAAFALLVSAAGVGSANEESATSRISARLEPTQEVPAVSSNGSGHFNAVIDESNQTITYELSYADLDAPAVQAHIHIGQRATNGGISVFLCANAPAAPPAGVPLPPACPNAPATVTGVITPAHLIGPAAQGVNEFEELLSMLRAGLAYANVHSTKFPAGEVRGQIRPGLRAP